MTGFRHTVRDIRDDGFRRVTVQSVLDQRNYHTFTVPAARQWLGRYQMDVAFRCLLGVGPSDDLVN